MALNCPVCQTPALQPAKLEDSLPVLACPGCRGTLLSLVSYRHWRERPGSDAAPAAPADAAAPKATLSALCCPKCARFMTKFRVSADEGNQVDLCTHCDEVWLDRGEWELLERLALAGRLTQVFTQPWQYRLRSEQAQRRAEQRWREQLGADYERAREAREWIAASPHARELLAYLYVPQTGGGAQ